jgi:hypothetical protein
MVNIIVKGENAIDELEFGSSNLGSELGIKSPIIKIDPI